MAKPILDRFVILQAENGITGIYIKNITSPMAMYIVHTTKLRPNRQKLRLLYHKPKDWTRLLLIGSINLTNYR